VNKIPLIYGFNKCSEVGVDTFAPSIFLGGCNLRCPYCMNSKLINPDRESLETIDIEEIKKYVLEDNSEWLMISGGEPTYGSYSSFLNLLEEIKSWNCKIGLSTNGTTSEYLKGIISYLNYVAMDIKSAYPEDYEKIGASGKKFNAMLVCRSLLTEEKLKRDDFDYEIRTTLYPPFINEKAIKEIGSIMLKDDTWILQQFRHTKNMLDSKCVDIKPYSENKISKMLKIAKRFTEKAALRYV